MPRETKKKGGESVGNRWGIVGNRLSKWGIRVLEANFYMCFVGFCAADSGRSYPFIILKWETQTLAVTPGLAVTLGRSDLLEFHEGASSRLLQGREFLAYSG